MLTLESPAFSILLFLWTLFIVSGSTNTLVTFHFLRQTFPCLNSLYSYLCSLSQIPNLKLCSYFTLFSHTRTLSYLNPPLLTLTSPIWRMAQGRLFIWPRKSCSSARVICRPVTLSGLWSFMYEISDPNPGPSFLVCPNHSSPYLFFLRVSGMGLLQSFLIFI